MSSAPSIWPALLAFAAVIALIPAVLWVLKRLQGGLTPSARGISLAGGLALGPRERVTLIEVDGRRFLIGVTAQTISLIAELGPALPSPARASAASPDPVRAELKPVSESGSGGPAPTAAGFADLLTRLKRP